MRPSESSVSWADLHTTIMQCSASTVRDSMAEIAAHPGKLPYEGKIPALARLAASGADPVSALSLLAHTSLALQLRERGTPAVQRWLLENGADGQHLEYPRSQVDLSRDPEMAVAPVWVQDPVEGRLVRLARTWNLSGLHFLAQWEDTIGFLTVAQAVSRAQEAYHGQGQVVPIEVILEGDSGQCPSPPSFWSHRIATNPDQPDIIWARDRSLDRVEGSLWDAQERLLDDFWVRELAVKVGITSDPSVRARSEMYAGFTYMYVVGESDSGDRVSACEANLVRHLWRAYGKHNPRCLNIRPGGSERRLDQRHFLYVALRKP